MPRKDDETWAGGLQGETGRRQSRIHLQKAAVTERRRLDIELGRPREGSKAPAPLDLHLPAVPKEEGEAGPPTVPGGIRSANP